MMTLIIAHYGQCQTTKKAALDLHEYLGLNFKDSVVVSFCKSFGDFKVQTFGDNYTDYYFEQSGIKFRLDTLNKIDVILIFSRNNDATNQPVTYGKPLPFNISLHDNLETIETKLGEGKVINYNGRYDRIYEWTAQGSIKIAMYILLPRQPTDKSRIDYIAFSKLN
jgi:hypothetical protein